MQDIFKTKVHNIVVNRVYTTMSYTLEQFKPHLFKN